MKLAEITVPRWGLEMEEATFAGWLKQAGERVEKGEPVCTIETDKASGEVEAEASGRLVELVASPGDVVKPGDVLGRLEVDG